MEGVKVPKFKSDKEFRGWGLNGYKKANQLERDLQTLQTKLAGLEQKVPQTEAERTTLAAELLSTKSGSRRLNRNSSSPITSDHRRQGEVREAVSQCDSFRA